MAISTARHATLVPPRMKGKGYWDSLNLQGIRNNLGKVLVAHLCPILCDPMDCSPQAPLSLGFFRQEYWNRLPFPPPGDLPNGGIEPRSPASRADSLLSEPQGKSEFARGRSN